ncbi:MAG: zinc-dependent alcohol dehydrogenase, partial [Rhodospirillales bacterium]
MDAPAPQARPGCVLARTQASLISAGTERMVGGFAAKNLAAKALARPDLAAKVIEKAKRDGPGAAFRAVNARLDAPLPLGYAAAGTVIAVGEGLEGVFHAGQSIAMAGAGAANHAEINAVPANLCAAVPEGHGGVTPEAACYATLGAIALHAVRNAQTGLGDIVAVLGCGLVGQLAVQLLTIAGARVMALDPDAARRELALKTGAEWAFDPFDDACAQAAAAAAQGRGADAVIIAAAAETAAP